MKHWPRYVADWRNDTAAMSFEEQGAYSALLDTYYATEGPLPNDKQAIYRLTGAMTKKDQAAIDKVLARGLFHENGGGLHNKRADAEIQKYNVYCENQRRRRLGIKK